MFTGNNTNLNSQERTAPLINNYVSGNKSVNSSSRDEPIAGPSTKNDGFELQTISHNNVNELGETELHIAVLSNQVERIRELLRNSNIDVETQDKDNKYPHEYAIEGKNRKILELFSDFYKKCKTDIEQTERELTRKASNYDYRHEIINSFATLMGTFCAIYGAIAFFTSKSEVDVLEEFVLEEVVPMIAWSFQLWRKNSHFAMENLIAVTNEIKPECIKNTEALNTSSNKLSEKILSLEKRIKRFEAGKYANNTYENYVAEQQSLKSFINIHNVVLVCISLIIGVILIVGLMNYAISTRYLDQSRSQNDSLKKVNERLNQINSAISELDTAQEIKQEIREILLAIGGRITRVEQQVSKLKNNTPSQTGSKDDKSTSGCQSKQNSEIAEPLTDVKIVGAASRFL